MRANLIIMGIKREGWDTSQRFLKKHDIFDKRDEPEFQNKIETKDCPNLNICPGLRLKCKWDKSFVTLRDKENLFY